MTLQATASAISGRPFTTYLRDGVGSDDAQNRRYNRYYARFEQPDPADSSYDLADPQSFNRYSYTQNDPVNFTDPSGLNLASAEYGAQGCYVDGFFTDCRTALALVNSGSGLVQGGAGFYLDGSVLITEQQTGGENSRTSQRAYWLDLPHSPAPSAFAQRIGGARYPKPPPSPLEIVQKNFDDCARTAYREYRRTYLRTSGKAILGGAGVGAGGAAFYGIRWGIGLGIKGALHAAGDTGLTGLGRALTAGVEMAHGSTFGGIVSALSGKMALDSIKEAGANSSRLNAAVEDCKKRFPAADHSFSFLNF